MVKCLSIRAPWFAYILWGGEQWKDIENRNWPTRYRGPLLIHASKFSDPDEIEADILEARLIREQNNLAPMDRQLFWGDIKHMLGHVVGQVELVDCVTKSDSPWFFGKYGFVLRNRVIFEKPFPVRGQQGLFDVQVPEGIS